MKKIIVIPIVLFFLQLFTVSGQDTLKSFNNNWSTELNFDPFDGNLSLNNTEGQLKFRYLLPNNTAYRFALTMGYKQNNSNIKNVYGNNPYDNTSRQKSFLLGFNFGKEKHFNSSKRLSPYIGWELGIGFKTSSQELKNDNGSQEVKGAWFKYEEVPYVNSQYGNTQYYTRQTIDERGYWSVGGNLVMGFDFYMARNFYFGYELLFGCDYLSYSNIDITDKNNITTGTGSNSNSNYPDYDDESWKFGPKLVNGIRIGFVF